MGSKNHPNNHKKLCCSDGVCIPNKKTAAYVTPPWPQPAGVYAEGGFFSPLDFLRVVREVWHARDNTEMYGADLNIEHTAFLQFFKARRLEVEDENANKTVFFKLDGLLEPGLYTISGLSDTQTHNLIVTHEGIKCLRVDALSGPSAAAELHALPEADPSPLAS